MMVPGGAEGAFQVRCYAMLFDPIHQTDAANDPQQSPYQTPVALLHCITPPVQSIQWNLLGSRPVDMVRPRHAHARKRHPRTPTPAAPPVR